MTFPTLQPRPRPKHSRLKTTLIKYRTLSFNTKKERKPRLWTQRLFISGPRLQELSMTTTETENKTLKAQDHRYQVQDFQLQHQETDQAFEHSISWHLQDANLQTPSLQQQYRVLTLFDWRKNPRLFKLFPGPPWKIFQDLFGARESLNKLNTKKKRHLLAIFRV